ncbi:MAG TPA: glycosyltransferase family 4 protein [Acidimicrobiales bacterium]|nr:glycosyltransferase family 4 protein [Acidimicrobiales bacterium]
MIATSSTLLAIRSGLSYWSDYFRPDAHPKHPGYSTGWIAERLYGILAECGKVDYWDNAERPVGARADVFVGHFWAFADLCRANDFDRQIAVYVLSDPVRATALLRDVAERYGVPFPDWDLPPAHFDHESTMELADAVILVGNSATLATFDTRWHSKIKLVNYAPALTSSPRIATQERRSEFVYSATTCGLRKGFLDVIDTWRGIPAGTTQLHVVGRIDEPYRGRLASSGADAVKLYGWIPSASRSYRELLESCRYAYIPTWVEGQMGTVLDAIAAGCVPITTEASGVDDRVLEHCVIVEPGQPEQHQDEIAKMLAWSESEFRARQSALSDCMARLHTWSGFDERVKKVVWNDS